MKTNLFPSDKIQEMIKRKIVFNGTSKHQATKIDPYKTFQLRKKSLKKTPDLSAVKRLTNNDIVIMNMPVLSKVDTLENESAEMYRRSVNNLAERPSFFTNPHINSGLNKFQSFALKNKNINKENVFLDKNYEEGGQEVLHLKRYNSLCIRLSAGELVGKSPCKNEENGQMRVKSTVDENGLVDRKTSVPVIEFKPSFKQLLKRNSKIHSKLQSKLKKSEFNYQRAVSTSSFSRKMAFQKILLAFEQTFAHKNGQNPEKANKQIQEEVNNLKSSEKPTTSKTSRELQSRGKISRKSPEDRLIYGKTEQQQCRPWSAGKKALIKLQTTDEQNPLQFYSINDKY